MNRRIKLAILWVAKLLGLFALARILTRRGFVVIGWHGVSLEDEHFRLPEYFVTPETLRRRLQHLNKCFRIVSLEDAIEQHSRDEIRANQVVLTFDDGMYDFLAGAVPVLKEFEAPATVYVVSSTMESRTLAYPLLLREIVHSTRRDQAPESVRLNGDPRLLNTFEERERYVGSLQRKFFALPENGSRVEFLRKLAAEFEIDFEELCQGDVWRYLTKGEVRGLSNEGYSMQVHSHSHHSVVHYADTVFDEAHECSLMIHQVTGRDAVDYCYPSGFWDRRAWKHLRDAGMRSAVTGNLGPNFSKTPPLSLRRHIDTECSSQIEFEFAVSGLRWLMHALLHPKRWYAPSETKTEPAPLF